ncbi:RNA methyltransferase, TrmH family [Methylobacillus rhizosphaerae]|uniref:RNA methyltransferase, TrmH family n=1 Tax=Methylobacillus rhizosphaerae TaxID=551994 RepID=A0A238YVR0_9PROT|nr:RNA methyltransferase [Methylobacillus rhizosphaerae]SNR74663.1 RNA methyltransferase, TrmH family [Methylobacillus rhizosphaerae]
MTFKHITSRDNSLFKQLKKLADNARERRKNNETLLDGVHLLQAYMEQFGLPKLLVIAEGESTNEVVGLLQELADVPTIMFTTLMFAELSPVATPTGILALVDIPQLPVPEQADFALMLEDIQDPGNLGSMLRSAAAAGVDAVYLSQGCTDAWSPKALRGGQGAQFVVPIVERADLAAISQAFAGQTLATTLDGESLYGLDLSQPTAFVIGNEGAGLSPALVAAASHNVSIPMAGQVESLNAAAATAVCLFERSRQKMAQG